jgi:hypothetical protein
MGTKAQLKCPNGCAPLQPFKQPDAHGWECPKCGYFYNTKQSPTQWR